MCAVLVTVDDAQPVRRTTGRCMLARMQCEVEWKNSGPGVGLHTGMSNQ